MAVRRLYEPLCIAFGTTVSSPTVPTYQLYDLPHKFTPRLYMESEDPNLVPPWHCFPVSTPSAGAVALPSDCLAADAESVQRC